MLICFAISSSTIILVLHWILSAKWTRAIRETKKSTPYECGVDPVGTARTRFHVRFFMVAILFLLFDVEAVFLYLWGPLAFRLKWIGLLEMAAFLIVVILSLMYAWGKGALEQE